MDIIKLEKYNNTELDYGINDCNIHFLELFEPEMYEQIKGRYTTEMGGARVANKLFGYTNLNDFIQENDNYEEIQKQYTTRGCVFVKGKHVAICLGNTTFALLDNKFKPVPTIQFIEDKGQVIYKRK